MKNNFALSQLSSRTFLVTGGAGFIGSNIVEHLLKNQAKKVKVLDNLATGYKKNIASFLNHPNFEFVEGDIRDFDCCLKTTEGVDVILHHAALGSVPRSINDPITSNSVNVTGFLNMLVAAKDNKVDRFIYASSSSTYGDNLTLPKVEGQSGKPLSPYAVTKQINELYADVFAKTYGLKVIGLKYFNVFGPRQNTKGAYAAVIPLFINSILNDTPVFIDGDGLQARDFTYVTNVVQANLKAALTTNQDAFNQVFNIALGNSTSVKYLYESVKKFANSNMDAQHRPTRPGDIKDSLADISKAVSLLDYSPEVSVEEGLKITFDWFANNQEFVKQE